MKALAFALVLLSSPAWAGTARLVYLGITPSQVAKLTALTDEVPRPGHGASVWRSETDEFTIEVRGPRAWDVIVAMEAKIRAYYLFGPSRMERE